MRIVEVGDYSRELCGGTHVGRAGQLGLVKLLSEGSVGSGVRRVEALVGIDAFRFLAREHVLVNQLAEQFRAQPEELPERISGVVDRLRAAEKELENVRGPGGARVRGRPGRRGGRRRRDRAAWPPGRPTGSAAATCAPSPPTSADGSATGPAWSPCSPPTGTRSSFVVATTSAARDRGLAAGDLVKGFAPTIGGRGGGKADLAQGGGTPDGGPGGMDAGIGAAIDALRHQVAGAAGA